MSVMITRKDRTKLLLERIERIRSQMPENKSRMIDFALLSRLLNKLERDLTDNEDFENYCVKIDKMLDIINSDPEFSKTNRKSFFKIQEDLYVTIRMKHQYVRSGYYMAIFIPFSLAIGPALGILIKNVALGLALTIPTAFILGTILDQRAKKSEKQY